MPSLGIKPTAIPLFPTATDRPTLKNAHQQYYLSPPLTPYPRFPSYNDNPELGSLPLSSYHPTLPALQEMIPHETQLKKLTNDSDHFNQPSALQQHPEQERKEITEHNPVAIYHNGQHMSDPARLTPLYSAQPHNLVPPSSTIIAPLLRRNKAHVASACVNCKKAHLACDGKYPHLSLFPSIYGCMVSSFLP